MAATRRSFVIGLVAALFAVLLVAPSLAAAASDVLDLKKADFDATVKKEDLILVEVSSSAHDQATILRRRTTVI